MGNHELYMRRRRPDPVQILQMKAEAKHERKMKREERYVVQDFFLCKQVVACNSVSKLSTTCASTACFQWQSQPDIWSCKYKVICLYRQYNESISEEMNNDNDLNLHLNDQMSGRLRYGLFLCFRKYQYLVFSVFFNLLIS